MPFEQYLRPGHFALYEVPDFVYNKLRFSRAFRM